MSNQPFGFGVPGDDEPDREGKGPSGSENPFAAMFGGGAAGADNPFAAMFGNDPQAIQAAFAQLGQLMSYTGGPVNWDLAQDVARKTVSAAGDRSVSASARGEVEDAVRLAELWLDPVTTLPQGANAALAWSRAEWVEATLPVWKTLVEPVAARVVAAMGEVMPAEMAGAAAPLMGVLRQMGGAMFGAQVGQALGSLAGEVVGATDIGLPLGPPDRAVLLPANVEAFGAGLGVDSGEVRLYLALREAAHQRLYAAVPWLRAHVLGAVEAYAGGISVNLEKLEEIVGGLDPTNPEAITDALSEGMFAPETTPEQRAALSRLETALALVEGWVDEVAGGAAAEHLSSAAALRETVRRRRASGGPAEQTFGTLIGLELRPRRLREAAALWRRLAEERGTAGRDAVWDHPDLLPRAEDLDDPEAFLTGAGLDISALLDTPPAGEPGDTGPPGDGPTDGDEPPTKDQP